jgi:signal transduction histidine kinase
MSDVRRWSTVLVHRWTSPGPQLDWVVVAALIVTDVIAQGLASADVDVSSAELAAGPVILAAASAGILFWRRTRPLAVLGGVLALYAIAAEAIEPGLFTQLSGAATVLALYAVASWSARRRWAVVIPVVLLALVVSGSLDDGNGVAESLAAAMAVVALPWVLGYAARTRRLYLHEVERRLADAERERDVRARQAVLAERAHIARELHDVVAHHVSLIGVQAGAARTAIGHDPATTRAALEAIEASSRNAIGEMRHMLDALRDDDDATPLAPQPRLADVDRLVAGLRAAGIDATVRRQGRSDALPPLLELCCFRIIEEALTNVTRHSAATTVTVDIERRERDIRIAVADPGPPRQTRPNGDGGRGVVGMRERVALFDGRLAVGPSLNGGFMVVADLPAADRGADQLTVRG